MLFSSPIFLYVFLPIALIGVLVSRRADVRNIFLIGMSFIFYSWGELKYLPLIFCVILVTHVGSKYLVSARAQKGLVLASSVTVLLLILAFFKYYAFMVANLSVIGLNVLPELDIDLPLGISFFTFQAISQLVDVYRNAHLPKFQSQSLQKTTLYIVLFPQLVAGPIVRFGKVVAQMHMRSDTPRTRALGAKLFVLGLAMKVVIADKVAPIADHAFGLGAALDSAEAWLGITAYSMQIYFDFAGYSNMALGLGLYFGFNFPINFRDPYVSRSITEFWRRWHISLSSWFRDYLYIPLGGNRLGQARTLLNLFLVFLATGIWHGAAWNFVIWGLWHGLFMIGERFLGSPKTIVLGRVYALLVVMIGWVMFRASSFGDGLDYIGRMFGVTGDGNISVQFYSYIQNEVVIVMAIGLYYALVPRKMRRSVLRYLPRSRWLGNIGFALLLVVCMIYVANSTYSPFLYFRF